MAGFLAAELTTVSPRSAPLTWPVLPSVEWETGRIAVLTSIGLPQKTYNIRRRPEECLRHDGRWLFEPDRFVPGMGTGGPLSYMRLLVNGRKSAARNLAARGVARPEAAWAEIQELVRRAEEGCSSEAAVR